MKNLPIATAVLVVGACATGVAFSRDSTDKKGDEGIISREVRAAKERGDTEVTLPPSIPLPTGVSSIDEVLPDYSIVIAEPVHIQISLADRDDIQTWYRLRVLEWIVRQKMAGDEPPLPSELLPVEKDELVIAHSGGRATIDGVTVIKQSYDKLSLRISRRYLLFVMLSRSGRYGDLAAGSSSAFLVHPDGTLEALTGFSSPLVDDVQRSSGGVLSRFRDTIRGRLPLD